MDDDFLALEAAQYAGRKSQVFHLLKRQLPHDKRTQLATAVYETCKRRWGYMLPDMAEDREQLRAWCRETLVLEHELLLLGRRYLLTQLQRGGDTEKRLTARTLQQVIYPDDEIVAALEALTQADDGALREAAAKALALTTGNG